MRIEIMRTDRNVILRKAANVKDIFRVMSVMKVTNATNATIGDRCNECNNTCRECDESVSIWRRTKQSKPETADDTNSIQLVN